MGLINRPLYRRFNGTKPSSITALDGATYTIMPGCFVRADLMVGCIFRNQFSMAIKARDLPVSDPMSVEGLALVMPSNDDPASILRGRTAQGVTANMPGTLAIRVCGDDDYGVLIQKMKDLAHVPTTDVGDAYALAVVQPDFEPFAGWPLALSAVRVNNFDEVDNESAHLNARIYFKGPVDDGSLKVAVMVTAYNRFDVVAPCLRALKVNTERDFMLVMVDDGSEPFVADSIDALRKDLFQKTSVGLYGKNRGYLRSANEGVQAAFDYGADLVVVLNSDVLVTPGWLSAMVRAHIKTNAGLVNPLCNDAAMLSLPLAGQKIKVPFPFLRGGVSYLDVADALRFLQPRYPEAVTSVGNCMMISAQCWADHGPFDEAYGRGYGEECELWAKLIGAGGQAVVADDAYVWHESHATHGETASSGEVHGVELFKKRNARVYGAQVHKMAEWPAKCAPARRVVASSKLSSLPVQFFAIDVGPWGGAFCLLKLVHHLRELGVSAQLGHIKEKTHSWVPTFGPVKHGGEIRIAQDFAEKSGWSNGVFVATHWWTGQIAKAVCELNPGVVPMAFWQDREDLFLRPTGQPAINRKGYVDYIGIRNRIYNAPWVYSSAQRDLSLTSGFDRWIPVGVDTDLFRPDPAKIQPSGKIRVLAMWRPQTLRRGASRLREMYEILKRDNRFQLELFGWTDDAPTYCKRHGRLTQRQVADLMRQVDVFIEPSDYQGFGLPGLEAMASGAAHLSTMTKGVWAYANNDTANIVKAEFGDVATGAELAAALQAMSTEEIVRLKRVGPDSVAAYDWKMIAARWVQYLDEMWALNKTTDIYTKSLGAAAARAHRHMEEF